MKKNTKLNQWLWKWHVIAGLISLPFVLLLSITGGIYLFKADYETPKQKHTKEVIAQATLISLDKQLQIANKHAHKKPNAVVLSSKPDQATEFVSGRFSHKNSIFINPYTGAITGKIIPKNTKMHTVRKLHGELLTGRFGTKIIEGIASWMVVLILTGLYVWWPAGKWNIKGFFIPRVKAGKRILFRDLHAIIGFWMSGLLLLILAGGLPWTDIFGENFKSDSPLTIDQMAIYAEALELPGKVTLHLPKSPEAVFSVSNQNPSDLNAQKMIHFDQYSGEKIHINYWKDVGILMRGRMWVMAFHQGQFGGWNWWLMFLTAIVLIIMSSAALVSYIIRKKKGSWSIPQTPDNFRLGYGVVVIIVLLAMIFPLFGLSVLLIVSGEYVINKLKPI